jgi:hypothetical protein
VKPKREWLPIVGGVVGLIVVEFDATDVDELCTEGPSATVVLWSGTSNEDNGKVFCADPI